MKFLVLIILIIMQVPACSKPPKTEPFECKCYYRFSSNDVKQVPFDPDKSHSLYEKQEYDKLMDLCLAYEKPSREAIGWLAEASFAIAEIGAGNGVPNGSPEIYLDSASDEIAHDYSHATERPAHYWPKEIRFRYGALAICATSCYAETTNPEDENYSEYQKRLLVVLIRTKQYGEIHNFIKSAKASGMLKRLDATFFLDLGSQFIKLSDLIEGVRYIKFLHKHIPQQKNQLTYWRKLFLYAAEHDQRLGVMQRNHAKSEIDKTFPQ